MDGIPLLSGRPQNVPNANEDNCRRCNKEFNFLFARSKQCNHCGYPYCSSCTDYQALMPRSAPDTGYELVPVCAYCMEMLTITSSGKNKLRRLPMAQLRAYMKAYNIRAPGTAVEKDDLVEAILKSKNSNGCLYSLHEDYYRRNSVPQGTSRARNFFSRSTRDTTSTQPQAQTSYTPRQTNNSQSRPTYNTPPPTGSHYTGNTSSSTSSNHNQSSFNSQSYSSRNSYSHSNTHTHSDGSQPQHTNPYPTDGNRYASMSHSNINVPPRSPPPAPPLRRPRSATASAPPPEPPRPSAPVPTLNELLEKQDDEIARLPISTLKAILFDNRVSITVGVLEKADLVRKVVALVTDERRDREIKRQEELEESRRAEQAYYEDHQPQEGTSTGAGQNTTTDEQESSHVEEEPTQSSGLDNANSNLRNHLHDIPSSHEGLCVVCQDEHANMAIIDCGHLALCKSCSELVMQTSRECPLCRTRIVTEQRLLRIFRS